MPDIIKIKCPHCGGVLTAKYQQGIESKSVTCPICKRKSPFMDFKQIQQQAEEHTQYPDSGEHTQYRTSGEHTQYRQSADPKTNFASGPNLIIGRLQVLPAGPSLQLSAGRNIVGRRASQSSATVQIPVPDERKRMSREHLVIDVRRVQGKGFVHYVSLYKEKVNRTLVGSNELEYGDSIVLCHGDIIHLPDVDVRFELPDEEGTQF